MSIQGTIGALETLKTLCKNGRLGYNVKFIETIDYAIKQLHEGKKYKEIFEELEGITDATEWEMVNLKEIKEQYFSEPKPKKAMFLFEIEARDDKQMNDNIREFDSFINSANGGANERFHGRITFKGVK